MGLVVTLTGDTSKYLIRGAIWKLGASSYRAPTSTSSPRHPVSTSSGRSSQSSQAMDRPCKKYSMRRSGE
jgi:hypothetical protein